MITSIKTIQDLKTLAGEILLNYTDKVTKLSDGSVVNAMLFSLARLSQGQLKDISLIESQLFPDSAYGDFLDEIAQNRGISPRQGAIGSSSYLRLIADPGTIYLSGVHNFTSTSGIVFNLVNSTTIGDNGFEYVLVNSTTIGEKTNVDPLTINVINNPPVGHKFVTNEFKATGGRDNESDEVFRRRIKQTMNLFATSTLSKMEFIFNKINSKVLRVFHNGFDNDGKVILMVVSENGSVFSDFEFDELLTKSRDYLSLVELRTSWNNSIGVKLTNCVFRDIDISFRAEIHSSFNVDNVRIEMQNRIAKYFDFRFWDYSKKVEWDDILNICKNSPGIKYIYDDDFFPRFDINILPNTLPRVRGFLILDKNNNIQTTNNKTLNPIFYPFKKDFNYQSTILMSI